MYCPNCRAQIFADALVCTQCNADFLTQGGWRPVSDENGQGINASEDEKPSVLIFLAGLVFLLIFLGFEFLFPVLIESMFAILGIPVYSINKLHGLMIILCYLVGIAFSYVVGFGLIFSALAPRYVCLPTAKRLLGITTSKTKKPDLLRRVWLNWLNASYAKYQLE
jgi:predicted membrane protein